MRDNPTLTTTTQNIESFLQTIIDDFRSNWHDQKTGGRPQILSSLCLWSGVLVAILQKFNSILSIWRLISINGFWNFNALGISDEAVYTRLEKEGMAPFERLFYWISAILKEKLFPYVNNKLANFATMVVSLDETTLDKVSKKLPSLKQDKSKSVHLPGKLSALFDIRLQQWIKILFTANSNENERVLSQETIAELPKGSLVVADLGYFGFKWFDFLTNNGYYWISRLRAKTSYEIKHVFYEKDTVFDGLVWLGAYRADKASSMVRLIRFKIKDTWFEYITNVRDPKKMSIREVSEIYGRRWDIEIAFNLMKSHLKLNFIWSAKEEIWKQQVIGVLIISQILQALRVEIASKAKVDVYEVSMEVMIQVIPMYINAKKDPIEEIVRDGKRLMVIRPSRRVKREAPEIKEEEIKEAPEDLVTERTARYAGKS